MNELSMNDIEVLKIQYQNAIETFRAQYFQIISVITFLIISDVTVLGFALDKQITALFILANIFMLTIFFSYKAMKEMMKPIIYSAYIIEKKLSGNQNTSYLLHNFFAYTQNKAELEKLNIEEGELKISDFEEFDLQLFGNNIWMKIVKFFVFLIFILQLVLPFFLQNVGNWKFI